MKDQRGNRASAAGWASGELGCAIALAVFLATVLAVLTVTSPERVERIAVEDGPVEWLQVLLFSAAGGLSVWQAVRAARRGEEASLDIVLAFAFGVLTVGELDLDRRLLGVNAINTKFVLNPAIAPSWRTLVTVTISGLWAGLGVFAIRNRRELALVTARASQQRWGKLLIFGALVFGVTQLFERSLRQPWGLPPYLLEESLELIAAVFLFFAIIGRLRGRAATPHREFLQHRMRDGSLLQGGFISTANRPGSRDCAPDEHGAPQADPRRPPESSRRSLKGAATEGNPDGRDHECARRPPRGEGGRRAEEVRT